MRLLRASIGMLLLIVAVPVVLAGGALWLAMQHRTAAGTFTASLEPVRTDGHAIVVADVDALLRADAPFARGGQTTLSVSARGPGGPLFLGIGRYDDVEAYLADVARTQVVRVRPARGPLPVDAVGVTGTGMPAAPTERSFWLTTSTGLTRDGAVEDALTWSPSSLRGQRLALVVMNADGSPGVDVTLAAALAPGWLAPTTYGLTMLGTAVLLLGILTLAWPRARREIVHVVEAPVSTPAPTPPPFPPPPSAGLRLTWPALDQPDATDRRRLAYQSSNSTTTTAPTLATSQPHGMSSPAASASAVADPLAAGTPTWLGEESRTTGAVGDGAGLPPPVGEGAPPTVNAKVPLMSVPSGVDARQVTV